MPKKYVEPKSVPPIPPELQGGFLRGGAPRDEVWEKAYRSGRKSGWDSGYEEATLDTDNAAVTRSDLAQVKEERAKEVQALEALNQQRLAHRETVTERSARVKSLHDQLSKLTSAKRQLINQLGTLHGQLDCGDSSAADDPEVLTREIGQRLEELWNDVKAIEADIDEMPLLGDAKEDRRREFSRWIQRLVAAPDLKRLGEILIGGQVADEGQNG